MKKVSGPLAREIEALKRMKDEEIILPIFRKRQIGARAWSENSIGPSRNR
jgi:hypothetical protein